MIRLDIPEDVYFVQYKDICYPCYLSDNIKGKKVKCKVFQEELLKHENKVDDIRCDKCKKVNFKEVLIYLTDKDI